MKKVILKITTDLDHVYLTADGSTNKRWNSPESDHEKREQQIAEAKIALFDVAWQYAELGYKVELNPYIN